MPDKNPKYLSLENLGKGILLEKFDDALQDVLKNIDDPNFEIKAKRKISIDLTIKPIGKGNACTYVLDVKTKLAPANKHEGTIMTARVKGEGGYVASEVDLDQEEMNFNNVKQLENK